MKVLFVTPWYPADDHGYAGVFVREYAKAVGRLHDVVVVHVRPEPDPGSGRYWSLIPEEREAYAEGIPTYRLQYRGLCSGWGAPAMLLWALHDGLRRLARRHGPVDLIHAHVFTCGFHAAILGRLHGIPVVISEHSSGFPRRQLSRRGRIAARVAFRLADRVLPVSEALQRAIEDYGFRGNFRVVPETVDADVFAPAARRGERGTPPRLLFVGELTERKGLSYLFQAIAQLQARGRDVCLDVVGQGPELEPCRRLAASLGLAGRVTFLGAKSKPDVADSLRRADVFVLPSLCETFSVVTAEALASGVPVLVTRCGGPEEYVTETCGVVVPPGDAQALACGLDALLGRWDTFDRKAIAAAARERFGYEAVGTLFDEVYAQVTDWKETSHGM